LGSCHGGEEENSSASQH